MINGIQLRMARAALGVSVRELAKIAGIDKNTISRCEAGQRVMSDSLEKLERAMANMGVVFIGADNQLGPGVRISKNIIEGQHQHSEPKPRK